MPYDLRGYVPRANNDRLFAAFPSDRPIRSISYVADTYFYIKTDSANAHETLMARKRSDATGRNLVDLGRLLPGKSGSNFEIQPSGDGKFLAIGIPTGNEGYFDSGYERGDDHDAPRLHLAEL